MSGMLDESWQQHIASSVAHWSQMAKAAIDSAAAQYERPSAVFKPRLMVDGNQWCALYGDNLQDGVSGFGDSPADAMWDFDRNWGAKLQAQKDRSRAEEVLRAHGFPRTASWLTEAHAARGPAMSDALKPCPFCGERPQLTVRPDNADATTYFAAVVCYCDSYSACAHKMATAPNADEAEAAARAAWNRRAALSAPPHL